GIPTLFVPYPHAAHNHQMENALALKSMGAAAVIPESELTAERLAEAIEYHIRRPELLDSMRAALKNIVLADAAERIAELIESIRPQGNRVY
ncbi:MAG: undecaprenyldiphospho-muramoylpentapeptide beta-N-acetylglucosaminyltransferase, partial [Kiritimatiellae bacterium]|nr:undecaprenyldiphospho-muramoylpentapeptide beta-N-acetylglucosaminyltransferase [Kiritimatiellia bacterium]